jgi:hypothetical protein
LAGKAQQVLAAGLLQINYERSELSSVHKDFVKIARRKRTGKGILKISGWTAADGLSNLRDNLEPPGAQEESRCHAGPRVRVRKRLKRWICFSAMRLFEQATHPIDGPVLIADQHRV